MKKGSWCAAFTIEVDGKQIDWMELSNISRMEILLQLRKGITCGELMEEETWEQAAS